MMNNGFSNNDESTTFGKDNFNAFPDLLNDSTNITTDNKCWTRFLEIVKEGSKVQDSPRRQVVLDADLHLTLSELDLGELKMADKIAAVIRAFLESNIEQLNPFRRTVTRSLFDKNGKASK